MSHRKKKLYQESYSFAKIQFLRSISHRRDNNMNNHESLFIYLFIFFNYLNILLVYTLILNYALIIRAIYADYATYLC